MVTEAKNLTLQISEGYRSARRTTSVTCAVALAWSAAQFDFKAISFLFSGNVDVSHASIPLILLCAVAYSTVRCVLEFAMQSVEVRRWRYAQADFQLSVFLVRSTILILAASGLDRSVETVFYVALAALTVIIGSGIALYVVMIGVMFLLIHLRGRTSIASKAMGAYAWAELVVVLALVVLFVAFACASLGYGPLYSLWTVPPSPLALGLFVLACVATIVSIYLQRIWYGKLFARPPAFTEQHTRDGRLLRTYHDQTAAIWDWHSQPVSGKEQKKSKDLVVEVLPPNKP